MSFEATLGAFSGGHRHSPGYGWLSGTMPEADRQLEAWWQALQPALQRRAATLAARDMAADYVQDVAVLALSKHTSKDFPNQQAFAAWAYKALYFLVLNDRPATLRETALADASAVADTASIESDVDDELKGHQLNQIIDRLPPKQRDALKQYLQGFSGAEIASSLGVTDATARSLIRFAKARVVKAAASLGVTE